LQVLLYHSKDFVYRNKFYICLVVLLQLLSISSVVLPVASDFFFRCFEFVFFFVKLGSFINLVDFCECFDLTSIKLFMRVACILLLVRQVLLTLPWRVVQFDRAARPGTPAFAYLLVHQVTLLQYIGAAQLGGSKQLAVFPLTHTILVVRSLCLGFVFLNGAKNHVRADSRLTGAVRWRIDSSVTESEHLGFLDIIATSNCPQFIVFLIILPATAFAVVTQRLLIPGGLLVLWELLLFQILIWFVGFGRGRVITPQRVVSGLLFNVFIDEFALFFFFLH